MTGPAMERFADACCEIRVERWRAGVVCDDQVTVRSKGQSDGDWIHVWDTSSLNPLAGKLAIGSTISGFPEFRQDTMNAIARIQDKGQVTIPTRVRKQAGLSKGDVVEFSYRQGKIVMIPKTVIDRSKFPVADEYTPEQRRAIDVALREAEKGPFYGPFKRGGEVAKFLKQWKRQHAPKRIKRSK